MADQPTMNPDALTGPGRALQQLGKAISGLQGAFEASTEPTDNEKFQAQLSQLQFHNEAQNELQQRQANFTPDADPSAFTADWNDWYNTRSTDYRGQISQNPKIQQGWALNDERLGGQLHRNAYGFQSGEITKRTVNSVVATFTGTIAQAPAGDVKAIAALTDMIDQQIGRVHGASPAQVNQMRESLQAAAIKQLLLPAPGVSPEQAAIQAPQLIEEFISSTVRDKAGDVPPGIERPIDPGRPLQDVGPRDGLGPQSSAGPVIQENQKAKLKGVSEDVVAKFGQLQSETGVTFKINSGFRDPEHNAKVGGAKGSQHIHGNALDLDVSRMTLDERKAVIEKASALGFTGIGVYKNSIHLDSGNRRSWGPDYSSGSVPKWARETIDGHLAGSHKGGGGQVNTASGRPPETLAAVEGVARNIGAHPDAIGAVFTVESGKDWDPKARTGSYRGVSQVGAETLREMGVSEAAYGKMSQAEQAAFYGKWLEHYNFSDKMQAAGIDFKAQSPARQAAILQAFQFAPNGAWVKRLGDGETGTPVTNTKQARALGSTSIDDMERYFASSGVARGGQAVAESQTPRPVQVADASGRVPGAVMSDHIKASSAAGERAANTVPGRASNGVRYTNPSIRTGIAKTLIELRPKVQADAAKAMEKFVAAQRVAQFIAGDVAFNKYADTDRKLVDDVFSLGDLDKRMFAGEPQALMQGVEMAQRLNYAPEPVVQALMGLAMAEDDDAAPRSNRAQNGAIAGAEHIAKRQMGYEAAASILDRNPTAFAKVEGGQDLEREALAYTALVRSGKTSKAAIDHIAELRTPEWQAKEKVRREAANYLAKDISAAAVTDLYDPGFFSAEPPADFINMLHADYVEKFKEHYIRIGDQKSARALAAQDIKKHFGVSNVTGSPAIMEYPPDNHYPAIGGSLAYVQEDLEATVGAWIKGQGGKVEEVTGDRIKLIPDGKTAAAVAKGDPPTYGLSYRLKDSVIWQKIPGARWGMGSGDIEAARKALETSDAEKRKDTQEIRVRRDENIKKSGPIAGWLRSLLQENGYNVPTVPGTP